MAKEKKKSGLDEIASLFKSLKSETGSTLVESPYSNVQDWISTGSYAFNILLSGSPFKGVAAGRATAFAGLSGVGKSYMTMSTIKHAQEKGYYAIYIDTENAVSSDFAKDIGCNAEYIWHENLFVIEEVRNFVINKVGDILNKNPGTKIMLVMDSLGNLSSEKDKRDIKEDKRNADMGSRAKALKDMLRNMIHFCAFHHIPYIYTNHAYRDVANSPNPMYAKLVMSGGNQPVYMASVVALASAKDIKDKVTNKVFGRLLTVKTDKNRIAIPNQTCEIMLSFREGLLPYFGLAPFAVEAGLFNQTAKTVGAEKFEVKHMKKTFNKLELYSKKIAPQAFNSDTMSAIEEYCLKNYTYSSKYLPEDDISESNIEISESENAGE
jgi:RecA/RadA recombinase